jgi:hypothetical protein
MRPNSPGPFDLYAFSSRIFEVEVDHYYRYSKVPGLHDTVLLSVIERREHKLANRDQTLDRIRETGFICSLKDSSPPNFRFQGRLIDPKVADFDLIRSWLQTCRTCHTRLCGLESVEHVPGFKIIDCETRHIIQPTKSVEYLALSYVWGSASSETIQNETVLPESIPQVIKDAIEVTRKLHYQFL